MQEGIAKRTSRVKSEIVFIIGKKSVEEELERPAKPGGRNETNGLGVANGITLAKNNEKCKKIP